MDGLRSRSYADGRANMESSYAAASGLDMMRRSCSYSANSHRSGPNCKKGKSTWESSSSSSSSSSFAGWGIISEPELQRMTRVAGYKAYAVEGKMKGSFRKSFRWIKHKYTQVLYGRF